MRLLLENLKIRREMGISQNRWYEIIGAGTEEELIMIAKTFIANQNLTDDLEKEAPTTSEKSRVESKRPIRTELTREVTTNPSNHFPTRLPTLEDIQRRESEALLETETHLPIAAQALQESGYAVVIPTSPMATLRSYSMYYTARNGQRADVVALNPFEPEARFKQNVRHEVWAHALQVYILEMVQKQNPTVNINIPSSFSQTSELFAQAIENQDLFSHDSEDQSQGSSRLIYQLIWRDIAFMIQQSVIAQREANQALDDLAADKVRSINIRTLTRKIDSEVQEVQAQDPMIDHEQRSLFLDIFNSVRLQDGIIYAGNIKPPEQQDIQAVTHTTELSQPQIQTMETVLMQKYGKLWLGNLEGKRCYLAGMVKSATETDPQKLIAWMKDATPNEIMEVLAPYPGLDQSLQ